MSRRRKVLFAAVVAAQVAILVLMIARQTYILAVGERIRLRCEPIDPRSLVSGDYVRLNYAISRLDAKVANLTPQPSFRPGEEVYVGLEKAPGDDVYVAAVYGRSLENVRAKHPKVIRGVVESGFSMHVLYGVEEYFVPQNEGKRIEARLGKGAVVVEIALMPDGSSAIARLFVDGQAVEFY